MEANPDGSVDAKDKKIKSSLFLRFEKSLISINHFSDHLSVTFKCTVKCILQVFLILKLIIIYNYNSFKCYIYMYFYNSNK